MSHFMATKSVLHSTTTQDRTNRGLLACFVLDVVPSRLPLYGVAPSVKSEL